jgi:hypothetical protein
MTTGPLKGSSTETPSILDLQRLALEKALTSLDLDAPQSATSCNSKSCNYTHPTAEEVEA